MSGRGSHIAHGEEEIYDNDMIVNWRWDSLGFHHPTENKHKMPSLSDHIDRLAANAKNISLAAHRASISTSPQGLFSGAILLTHLGDLIRDADPSELGLFSLVHPERVAVQDKPLEIERINFHGATPLRRSRPDDPSRARDFDPELYAQAAMKYMDR